MSIEKIIKERLKKLEENPNIQIEPAYRKYCDNKGVTIYSLHPSWIMDKTIGGAKKGKLLNNKPNKERYREFGFDEQGKCLYETLCTNYGNTKRVFHYHFHTDLQSVRVYVDNIGFYEIFKYNENGTIASIREKDPVFKEFTYTEDYNWLHEDIAIIKACVFRPVEYLLIKNKEEILAIVQLAIYKEKKYLKYKPRTDSDFFEVNDSLILKNDQRIDHPTLDITYGKVMDKDNRATQYSHFNVLGETYIGTFSYQKLPKGFSYKKAKEIFKEDIKESIQRQIERVKEPFKHIGIQYFNEGYDVTEFILIGFDVKEEIAPDMRESYQLEVKEEHEELMNHMNNYINTKGYFNSFRKIMEEIAKWIEEKYEVKVIIDEVTD